MSDPSQPRPDDDETPSSNGGAPSGQAESADDTEQAEGDEDRP